MLYVQDCVAAECFLANHFKGILRVKNTFLENEDLEYCALSTLRASKKITELHLMNCNLDDDKCRLLTMLLHSLPDLLVLDLIGNKFSVMQEFVDNFLTLDNGHCLPLREMYLDKLSDKTRIRVFSFCMNVSINMHLVLVGTHILVYADKSSGSVKYSDKEDKSSDEKDDIEDDDEEEEEEEDEDEDEGSRKRVKKDRVLVMSQNVDIIPVVKFLSCTDTNFKNHKIDMHAYRITKEGSSKVNMTQQVVLFICWLESRKSYLSKVAIENLRLSNTHFHIITKWMATAHHVTMFSVRGNRISALRYIIPVLIHNKSITRLDLSCNKFCSDDSTIPLFVKYNTSVDHLLIDDNNFTDLFPFILMVEDQKSPITQLYIGDNPMCIDAEMKLEDSSMTTSEAIGALLGSANTNPRIRVIVIRNDWHWWDPDTRSGPFLSKRDFFTYTNDQRTPHKLVIKNVELTIDHGQFISRCFAKNNPVCSISIENSTMTRQFAEDLAVLIGQSTILKELKIGYVDMEVHLEMISHGLIVNTSIESLFINAGHLSNVDCIARVLHCPNNNIRCLNLSNNNIASFEMIGNALCDRGSKSPIKQLHLFNNKAVKFDSLMYSFAFLRNLEDVSLYCNKIDNDFMLNHGLSKNTSIKSLTLGNNPMVYTEAFGKTLAAHPTIQTLELSQALFLDMTGMGHILRSTTTITDINLANVHNPNVHFIAAALAENRTVVNLTISGNKIVDVSALGPALSRNSTLENLYLHLNEISDVKDFSAGLASNKGLRNLLLSNNRLDNYGCELVMRAVLENPNSAMIKVDLGYNKISKVFPSLSEFARLMTVNTNEVDVILHGNPLVDIEKAVYSINATTKRSKLRPFLLDVMLNGDVLDKEMKLVFAGNGNAGKTTLFRNLCNPGMSTKESLAQRASTHGIQTEKWRPEDNDGGAASFTVLDFAGQMEYFQLHSHFLPSKRAIYVLCYDASEVCASSNPRATLDASLRSWVSFVQSNIPPEILEHPNPDNISLFVVQTKMDKVKVEIIHNLTAYFEHKFPKMAPFFKGLFSVDYTNVNSVLKLRKALITTASTSVRNLNVSVPRVYSHIVNSAIPQLQAEFQRDNKFPLLSLQEFTDKINRSLSSSDRLEIVPRKDSNIALEIEVMKTNGDIYVLNNMVVFNTQALVNFMLCFLSYRGETPSSSSSSPLHHIIAPGGIVARDQVLGMCQQYNATEEDVKSMIDVLLNLGVVVQIEGTQSLFVPMALDSVSQQDNETHFPYREGFVPITPNGNLRIYSYVISLKDESLIFPMGVFAVIQKEMISKFGVGNAVLMRSNFSVFNVGAGLQVSVQMVESQRTLLIHAMNSNLADLTETEQDSLSDASQAIVNIVVLSIRKLTALRYTPMHVPDQIVRESIFSKLHAFGLCPLCTNEDCLHADVNWGSLPIRDTHHIGSLDSANLEVACPRHPNVTIEHIVRPMLDQNMRDWINMADWDPDQYFQDAEDEMPFEFKCPLSRTLMMNPMRTPSGGHYERAYIIRHLKSSPRDPYLTTPLRADQLVLDTELKNRIVALIAQRQQQQQQQQA